MLKTRLLVFGLLAAPACTVPYPYNPHASNPQRDAWATNSTATATTENGTVVVLVVDQEALDALTRQAASQGRTVVQLRVEGGNAGNGSYAGRVESNGNVGGGVARAPRTQTANPAPVTDVARGFGETSVRTQQPNAAPQPRNGFAPVAQSAPRKQPLPQQPVVNAPVPQQQVVTGPVANAPVASAPVASAPVASAPVASAPVAQPSPVSEAARPVTRVLRPTGPGTENGYSAYGSVTGSQGLRATGWNGAGGYRMSKLPHPTLFGNGAAQNGASSATTPKKSGSSYWGPRK